MDKLKLSQALVVEGRDDVAAVSEACEALIIPTHGFGITSETWSLIEKAYKEKGLIILTDPDFSGEEIRRKLTARFPEAIQAYVAKCDALSGADIGIENASPEVIKAALSQALELSERIDTKERKASAACVTMSDLAELGLTGGPGASELRAKLCAKLGIGYGNASALIKKLKLWNIEREELEQAVQEILQK